KRHVETLLTDSTRFLETAEGVEMTLTAGEIEWVLQVLNDVRVGNWILLGSPEEHPRLTVNIEEVPLVATMELASMFQMDLLDALSIFPCTVSPISWWSPDPRAILELDKLHVPESLNKVLRKKVFRMTIDTAFPQVIRNCAARAPGRIETWITKEFIAAYTRL